METDNNLTQKVIGYILLSPALISVLIFFWDLVTESNRPFENLSWVWIGYGENHSSSLPFYFGLMAMAGAYLIKDSNKK